MPGLQWCCCPAPGLAESGRLVYVAVSRGGSALLVHSPPWWILPLEHVAVHGSQPVAFRPREMLIRPAPQQGTRGTAE